MLATEYAKWYEIAPQSESESDDQFKRRVAGALRDAGHIIEEHEVSQDARYEESGNVMTGILGAVAMALHDVDYGKSGDTLIGDELAAGTLAKHAKTPEQRDADLLMAQLGILLMGGK